MGSLFDAMKAKSTPKPATAPVTAPPTTPALSAGPFGARVPLVSALAFPTPAPVAAPAPAASLPPTPAPAAQPTPALVQVVSTFDPFAVITGQAGDADAVLNALVQRAEEKPSYMGPFDTVLLAPGQSGGMLTPHDGVSPEMARLLPAGKRPFGAVFLGWRLNVLAFPLSKEDADAKGVKADALFSGSAGCGDATTVPLIQRACEAYQFTPKVQKSKFDNLGHVRPALELLFFAVLPDGGPMVFTVVTPPNHTAVTKTLVNLSKALPGGRLQAVPFTVTPVTEDQPGATKWPCHSLTFALGLPTSPEWEAFAGIRDQLRADAEFSAKLAEWSRTSLDAKAIQALTTIAAMGKG